MKVERIAAGMVLLMGLPGLLAAQTAKPAPARPATPARPSTAAPAPAPAKDKQVVEEIVARINNEIVTLSDFTRAKETVRQEVQEECRGCAPAQMEAQVAEREKNLLRDLIDQSLLAQRGKDVGINVETDVVRRLDDIRQNNNFGTMEDLQKKVEETGQSWEDFKSQIRNSILTQEVIRRQVMPDIIVDKEEVKKYYEEHKNEFVRPEKVYLSEIFVSTVNKPEAEIPALEAKAKKLLDRVKNGEDFNELAKHFSDGDTAKQGGELGGFERGQLSKELEDRVFKLKRNEMTDVIRTKTGFLVLRVDQRYEAGLQPLDKVENEIMNRVSYSKMQPALRKYLARLREESYVVVKLGFVDTSAVASSPIVETEPTPDAPKKKKKDKEEKGQPGAPPRARAKKVGE